MRPGERLPDGSLDKVHYSLYTETRIRKDRFIPVDSNRIYDTEKISYLIAQSSRKSGYPRQIFAELALLPEDALELVGDITYVSRMLYGLTIDEFISGITLDQVGYISESKYDWKKWDETNIGSIDIATFLICYYTLLSSTCEYYKSSWEAIYDIIKTLNESNDEIWRGFFGLKSFKNDSIDLYKSVFLRYISICMLDQVANLMTEQYSYLVFLALESCYSLFQSVDWQYLRMRAISFLDSRAIMILDELLARCADLPEKELMDFSIEDYFFFKGLFEKHLVQPEYQESLVKNKLGNLYLMIAKQCIALSKYDKAREFLESSFSYAVDSQLRISVLKSLIYVEQVLNEHHNLPLTFKEFTTSLIKYFISLTGEISRTIEIITSSNIPNINETNLNHTIDYEVFVACFSMMKKALYMIKPYLARDVIRAILLHFNSERLRLIRTWRTRIMKIDEVDYLLDRLPVYEEVYDSYAGISANFARDYIDDNTLRSLKSCYEGRILLRLGEAMEVLLTTHLRKTDMNNNMIYMRERSSWLAETLHADVLPQFQKISEHIKQTAVQN